MHICGKQLMHCIQDEDQLTLNDINCFSKKVILENQISYNMYML